MDSRDTIAAVATAAGPAGIAVVRISGPGALEVGRRVFPRLGANPASHRLVAGSFVGLGGRAVDRGLAVAMRAPRSYTGEDVVELHCHGGRWIVRAVLGAVLGAGARAAEPGEFTLRAFLNDKLDLAQAEAVADLVSARSEGSAAAALRQLGGALSSAVEAIRESLVGAAARLEVAIDFTEEDVGALDSRSLGAEVAEIAARIEALGATWARGRVLRDGLRVAIVGRPNVGKSSLLNRLLAAERAIVTDVPGTTRDVLEESLEIEGVQVLLVDTAGLRPPADEPERLGVERTRREIERADLALLVLDGSADWTEADAEALDSMRQRPRLAFVNKRDLPRRLPESALPADLDRLSGSARSGEGIDSLVHRIVERAAPPADEGAVVVTRERHRAALDAAAEAVRSAARSLDQGASPDLVAVDVMTALERLGEIAGRTSPEDVLDRVFREFCIGK